MTADTSGSREPGTVVDPPTRRVGLFGGTFDPLHHGHLAAAWNVRQLLNLDEVWLVVANDPWQKRGGRSITPAERRLRWVTEAVEGFDGLRASDVEIKRQGASYTIDTVAELSARHPQTQWSVIVGADVAGELDTWHRAEELRASIEVVVINRPGADDVTPSDGWEVRHVSIPPLDLSSTGLRAMAAAGRSLHFLVPAVVADDVASSGLYRVVESGVAS